VGYPFKLGLLAIKNLIFVEVAALDGRPQDSKSTSLGWCALALYPIQFADSVMRPDTSPGRLALWLAVAGLALLPAEAWDILTTGKTKHFCDGHIFYIKQIVNL